MPPLLVTLLAGIHLSAQTSVSPAVPDAASQERMLTDMHRYAAGYVSDLPNFICQQVTYQFEAGRQPKHWHKGDTLTSKLVFNAGREERTLELVNDKPIRTAVRFWRTPLTSEGEFGMLIETVFGKSSEAVFRWNRWDIVNGQRLAVFDYSIAREHSTLSLSLSDLAKATVAYHGSVYADPRSGAILRISNAAEDIPKVVQTRSIGTVIDYGEVDIAGTKYLLPARAVVSLATDTNNVRNEIHFQNYRKFEAESHITFASDAPAEGKAPPQ
ncbi:MAG: hypothetical protein JO270_06875 [Acidobacteriaceae bacterium]|nr:hypothetical protein [Acidobacteriaceae bacterium]